MTDTVMMNTETPKTKPTESTFKKVVLFPFRLVLVLFVLLNIFFAVRAAFPMDLPEAQGMTYYQFLSERFQTYKDYSKTDKNAMVYVSFAMYPGVYYGPDTFRTLDAAVHPGGASEQYLQTHKTGYPLSFAQPREELKWTNLPNLLWEQNERVSWIWFVIYEPEYRYPQPPTNK